jgi:hypothetical protein
MIQVMIDPPNFAYSSVMDTHGGKLVTIKIAPDVVAALQWVMEHKAKLEQEAELRQNNPALANAWDQYQVMMRLVMDDI